MMRVIVLVFFCALSVFSFGQGNELEIENVQLPLPKKASYHFSQVEPSIYINPKNTNEHIAGSVMND